MNLRAAILVAGLATLVHASIQNVQLHGETRPTLDTASFRTRFMKQKPQEKKTAKTTEFPYIVSVQMNNGHMAPGAIINKNFVFVEGYFIDVLNQKNTTVVAGITDLKAPGGTVHQVTKMTKHENMVWPHNNIGILRVCPPFPAKYRRVILPANGFKWPSKTAADFVYFDSSGKLTKVNAAVLADAECNALQLPNNWNAQTELCTQHQPGNICIFPFYPLLVSRGRLAGAQTWGVCDTNKTVSLMSEQFVDVAMYAKWIRKNSLLANVKCN